ncbi:unnamed protein product, partial [Prunus brigantina]
DISSRLLGLGFSFLSLRVRFLPQQLLSSFCDDETMPATTSPLLLDFHSYDFSLTIIWISVAGFLSTSLWQVRTLVFSLSF